jgi:hypothetical protein
MTIMSTDAAGSDASSRRVDGDGAPSRALIVAAVVVVVSWITAVAAFRSPDLGWKSALSSVRLLLAAAAVAATVGALVGLLRRSERPRFLVREGSAFVLPLGRAFYYWIVAEVLGFGLVTTFAIDLWAAPGDGDRVHTVTDRAFAVSVSAMALLMGAIATVMIAFALSERSLVKITPRAVVRPGWIRSRTIPWDALRSGDRPHVDGGNRTITLTIVRPELVVPPVKRGPGGIPRPMMVSLVYTSGHPGFLADTIRFYTDHPDRRDAIGTRAEYERLLTNLTGSAGQGAPSTRR